jgi:hypothetical protein
MLESFLHHKDNVMRFIRVVLAIAMFALSPLFLRGVVAADQTDEEVEKTTAMIQEKLERLHQKLTDPRARALGFDSVEQMKNARPDALNRLPIFYVRLDKLRVYDGNNPWLLLEQTNSFIYPIVALKKDTGNYIVSAVVVNGDVDEENNKTDYRLGQLGFTFAIPIKILNRAKEQLLVKSQNCDYFLISIPALNKRLLGVGTQNICDFRVIDLDRKLEELLDNPSIQSANTVFEQLRKDASNHKKFDMPRQSNPIQQH